MDIRNSGRTDLQKHCPLLSNSVAEFLRFKNLRNFNYENEMNDLKSRCGIYVRNNVLYVRRTDLEVKNMLIVIIDINNDKNIAL